MTTTSAVPSLPPARTLLTGLTMVEGARWHEGRLWFAHWGIGEVVAVDLDGRSEVIAPGPPRMGWAFDWLPDGRRITTGASVTRTEADGTEVTLREQAANEVVVDPTGHVFVDGFDFDFLGGGTPEPGWIDLVAPDGSSGRVGEDIQFPNGMVVTPDGRTLVVAESFASRLTAFDIADDGSLTNRRVWADGLAPDGICIDAEGGIWAQAADTAAHTGRPSAPSGACVRVLEGGEITHRIEVDQPCFACGLGGPDGRSLFLLCNDFEGVDQLQAVLSRRSARVLVTEAPVPAWTPSVR
ncbi:SMP-30/gluconolactonase/LRE family protein [Actinomycetospora endophytica]|uniref:SMP-30/gluconolactonase/LRE family protein n=1 Tax=Actinomycetospora endophytica TaxID=2291215 RepID=A0ABS8PET3_9PSEU|nr:SMP-30/gluconolactonase/LRE family protein [Actinomycetospora endophytica]MCD2196771.1 SMP-30/gluconolactonase/LRE family protein [Actinomycetospora endophytica]